MENLISTLYAIPHYSCNLSCPHCDIHKNNIQFEEDIFISRLKSLKPLKCVLFGGEPLLYKDVFKRIIATKKINSVSTNLLLLDKEYIDLINEYKLSVATSWNFSRFTDYQETIWISNVSKIKCDVLITLTKDLITKTGTKKLKQVLESLNKFDTVEHILFEQEVNDLLTEEHFNKVDEWLCDISKDWNYSFENSIINKTKDWNCDCSKVMTLEPNGDLKQGCPQYSKSYFLEKCYSCELNKICKPCILQKECSFPKRLYSLWK